ncbi:hypothetical protein [Neptuniibacter sp. CAU 1671]|uniref:hypothetical protein n=1 Tax=Neptuniibacter sp. CAU 1671 TaxID=3032593 RepID=UPI0023DBA2B6|nr:hypothetical protein [Neptuniibacter sp. CAU 1671]MDF2182772.1 hypothetical protein [Neptuniibacter sp. CAU 1671]
MIYRWRKQTAYLHTWVYQDLMGDWIITRSWGDTVTEKSTVKHQVMPSFHDARQALKRTARYCRRQGYQPCSKDETQLGFNFPDK